MVFNNDNGKLLLEERKNVNLNATATSLVLKDFYSIFVFHFKLKENLLIATMRQKWDELTSAGVVSGPKWLPSNMNLMVLI